MKRFILCLLVLATVLSAASCVKRTAKNSPEEVFSTDDVTITLSSAFQAVKTSDYAACFEASDVTVYLIQEKFEDLEEDQASLSLEDYAELVRANNVSKNPTEIVEAETGLTTFEYTYEDPFSGDRFKTFNSLYRTANSFWTIQFCCEEAIYDGYLELFDKWARSVFFTLRDMNYIVENKVFITMAEGFIKQDLDEFLALNRIIKTGELIAYYKADDGTVINVKTESKKDSGVKKLNAYTQYIQGKYKTQDGISDSISKTTDIVKDGDIQYFELEFRQSFPNEVDPDITTTETYKYFIFCVQDSKNFYTFEMGCAVKDYESMKNNFLKWAQTATTEWEVEE